MASAHGFGGHAAESQVPDEQDPDGLLNSEPEEEEEEEEPEGSSSSGENERALQHMKRSRANEKEADMFVDLGQFFGSIPPEQQISICRAYGSYLAAVQRARIPKKPRTYIKSGLFRKKH